MADSQPSRSASTDHNLLFGVLALQADLIDNTRFVDACAAWAARKDTPLADLLIERGWITPADRADVDRLLERKLRRYGGDTQVTLASVAGPVLRPALPTVDDLSVQQSLAELPPSAGHVLAETTALDGSSRDRYTLTRLHATGGIGQVWLAHDPELGREVALKELRSDRGDSPVVRERFLQEARITGQLEHPGIVPVYQLARHPDQQPYYTMRFVRGRTLGEAIKDYHRKRNVGAAGSLDLANLLNAFVGVCNAIAYAHARGVVHRDLKG